MVVCAHTKVTLLHKCGHVNACTYVYIYIYFIYIYIYKYSSFCIDRLEKKRDRNLHISQHAYEAQSAQFEMNFKGKFSFEPC